MVVKSLKTIRESKGYSLYEMAKRLDMTLPAYIYLEENGQSFRLDILIRAQKISGLSVTAFWDLLKKESEGIKITKKGRKTKEYN